MRHRRWSLTLLAALLTGCGQLLPPSSPTRAWGVPYTALVVPDGSLNPFDGRADGYRVRIEARHASNTFLIAHELTHVWTWHHKRLMREWEGVPCAVQPAWHCTAREAHADAVAQAVVAAGCSAGDLGWPGVPPTGCTLPDPDDVHVP
ncbi:hypothetical protein [Deinococcus radiotolerans]|uniref:Lipoprotein n=1 Tax=Deinococcus radiotolerans TaxID=1309407 RepID=A0ABQ2FR03_9DEIO|nr:hypothetical protein [Deinococcus radiotolerans]GGL18199.1 hypothetical protein GCM10010844_41320 [Deinococcus radiotolerans]